MTGSQTKTFRVYVTRVFRECQYRSVEVEAYNAEDAEACALALADEDETFWHKANMHPLEIDEPTIDDSLETEQLDRDPDRQDVLDDYREECKADAERTGRF
jgi:hypothetical protein